MRETTLILLGLLFLVIGGFALERSEWFTALKQAVHARAVPTGLLNYGPMGKVIKQLALVKAVSNDYSRFPASKEIQYDIETTIFQKKRHVGELLYEVNPGGENAFPSSVVIHEEDFKPGWPLISVVVDENALYDPVRGIVSHKMARGRQWERLAYVSYYEDGKLMFATNAGLRLHGGRERGQLGAQNSYRLYFRKDYGENQFRPGILFGPDTEPLKRLVIHADRAVPFITGLAFDIARQIGAVVPEIKPVIFFLNGKSNGVFFLSEHVGKKQWESHFGHNNFAFYRHKSTSDKDSLELYEKLKRWATDLEVRMTMKEVDTHVDLDNLCRHLFSFMFCGTTDWRQGVAALDKSKPHPKWFWINWDMDQSFLNYSLYTRNKIYWEQEAVEVITTSRLLFWPGAKPRTINKRDTRSVLFMRLCVESPEFRQYFVRLVMDLLNHRISADFLKSRIDYYEQLARSYDESDRPLKAVEMLRDFVEHRPDFMRRQMQQYFGTGKAFLAEVAGPAEIKYEIDGYPEKGGYRGHYYKGEQINVEILSSHKKSFSHWLVNGKQLTSSRLLYPVQSETVVKPVLKKHS
ncbi:MAG: CotH kinase family protein [Deltaproteobacteria bacterium]|nr:CotH kinase family protein [Deltaproteobacteria bacterium]